MLEHYDNPGNDVADRLAKEAASPGKTHLFRPLLSREKVFIRDYTNSIGVRIENVQKGYIHVYYTHTLSAHPYSPYSKWVTDQQALLFGDGS